MTDPNNMTRQELIDELLLARASVVLLTEELDAKSTQVTSLLNFQSSAHHKKVRAKHDRDNVINQKIVLEAENKKLKDELVQLKGQLNASVSI